MRWRLRIGTRRISSFMSRCILRSTTSETRAASCSACVTRSEAAWEVPVGPPGQPWAGLSGFWGFPPFLALVETVAVAVHLQDMNVVCEPVQQRPSQALGTEHLGPLIER